jgi:hypothetical protein
VTPNVVSSDPRVATIKKNEERIEDLILIRLVVFVTSTSNEIISLKLEITKRKKKITREKIRREIMLATFISIIC